MGQNYLRSEWIGERGLAAEALLRPLGELTRPDGQPTGLISNLKVARRKILGSEVMNTSKGFHLFINGAEFNNFSSPT